MDNGPSASEQFDVFGRMWTDFIKRSADAGFSFKPDAPPPEAARSMRDATIKAWAQWWDEYLRSPQFVQNMKQSMDAAIQARKQVNDWMGKAHHEMGGASRQDVDELMLTLRHVERRIADATERLGDRLASLEARLDALDAKWGEPDDTDANQGG